MFKHQVRPGPSCLEGVWASPQGQRVPTNWIHDDYRGGLVKGAGRTNIDACPCSCAELHSTTSPFPRPHIPIILPSTRMVWQSGTVRSLPFPPYPKMHDFCAQEGKGDGVGLLEGSAQWELPRDSTSKKPCANMMALDQTARITARQPAQWPREAVRGAPETCSRSERVTFRGTIAPTQEQKRKLFPQTLEGPTRCN